MSKIRAVHVLETVRTYYSPIAQLPQNPAGIGNAVAQLLLPRIVKIPREHFFVIALDSRMGVLGWEEVHRGVIGSVPCSVASAFTTLIAGGAARYIIAHNHPSGQVQPSPQDAELTNAFMAASDIMQIPIVDHFILSYDGKWFGVIMNLSGCLNQSQIDEVLKNKEIIKQNSKLLAAETDDPSIPF